MANSDPVVTSPEDVYWGLDELNRLFKSVPQWGANAVGTIDNEINGIGVMVSRNAAHQIDFGYAFKVIGGCAVWLYLQHAKVAAFPAEQFANLLLEKHKRYGAAPLRKWGPVGVVIRISSKWERFKNMGENVDLQDTSIDESIVDTLKDIIGYCVLGYILANRTRDEEIKKGFMVKPERDAEDSSR